MNWIILALLLTILLVQLLIYRQLSTNKQERNKVELHQAFERIEKNFREDFKLNREESREIARDNREELAASLKEFKLTFEKAIDSFNNIQREKFSDLKEEQQKLILNTEKRLDEIRITVEEKLQKTLNERIAQSFRLVNEQLENVQKGLGEMQALAQDVGGLKKVLTNVKTRGNIGEIQLGMLLEQILAPEQYEANVKTKKGSDALVEYAVKLPAKTIHPKRSICLLMPNSPKIFMNSFLMLMIRVIRNKLMLPGNCWKALFAKWQKTYLTNTWLLHPQRSSAFCFYRLKAFMQKS